MARVLKAGVLEHATSYLKLAEIYVTSTDNIKPSKALDIGIATKRELVVY